MAWIESHTVLGRHRKLKELSLALRLRPAYVIGHLHLLWHAALEQQEDGDLMNWSDEFIAESAGYPGDAPQFVRLLQETGWLDGRLLHDWLDYSGRYLEAKYRTANPEKLRSIVSKHPKSVLNRSKVGPDKITLPNQPNQPTPPPGAFEIIWQKYPRREGKKAAEKHFHASVKTLQDWLDIQNALENYQKKIRKEGTDAQYILHGKTWFFNWRDYVGYSGVSQKQTLPPPKPIAPDPKPEDCVTAEEVRAFAKTLAKGKAMPNV